MAILFQDFSTAEKATIAHVQWDGAYSEVGTGDLALSSILDKKPVSLVTFVDIGTAPSTYPERAWIQALTGIYSSALEISNSVLFLVILGKKAGNVPNPGIDYGTFFNTDTGYASIYGAPFVIAYNNDWSPSIGEVLMGGFSYASAADIITPMTYLVGNQTGSFRILEKFHMQSLDTGNSEYGAAPNLAIVKNDIFSFRRKDSGGTLVYPDYPTLQAFVTRRMKDHAELITQPHFVDAGFSPAGTAMDLGSTITFSFSQKTIGADKGSLFQWSVDGGATMHDFADADIQTRSQLILKSDVAGDASYLDSGESAKIAPTDSFLLQNEGGNLSLHLKGAGGPPPAALVKTSNLVPFTGATPATPLLVKSFLVGKPSVYVRANPADTGSHQDPLCVSPDIVIVHSSSPADSSLSVTLRDPTHIEPSTDIESPPSTPDHENRLFVRLVNKGTMQARNVKAALYYAQGVQTTISMPTNWLAVNNFFASPTTIPAGSTSMMTVSEDFRWTSNLPDTTAGNHFCFICLVGCDGDFVDGHGNATDHLWTPGELAGQISTWDAYLNFVHLANVAWKNFNVIPYPKKEAQLTGIFDPNKQPRPTWVKWKQLKIPTKIPLPPFHEQVFFEVAHQMPANVNIGVTIPRTVAERTRERFEKVSWAFGKETAGIQLCSAQFTRLPVLNVQPKDGKQFVLFDVTLPESCPKGVFPIALRQLHRGREIGRITYLVALPDIAAGKPVFERERA